MRILAQRHVRWTRPGLRISMETLAGQVEVHPNQLEVIDCWVDKKGMALVSSDTLFRLLRSAGYSQ